MPPFEPLSEMLQGLRLRSTMGGVVNLGAPWGIRFPRRGERPPQMPANLKPPEGVGVFHVILEGRCLLMMEGDPTPVVLEPGDLAVVLHHAPHALADSPTTPQRSLWDVLPPPSRFTPGAPRGEITAGGTGVRTRLLGGAFFFDSPDADRLLVAMPKLILLRHADQLGGDWLSHLVGMATREIADASLGGQAFLDGIVRILLIQAIRHHVRSIESNRCTSPECKNSNAGESSIPTTNWLSALLDEDVGPALAAIHREPQRPWTVASLAEHVVMSRSGFAAKFNTVVGRPPLQYVTEYRMRRASDLLSDGTSTVKRIAASVGYDSEAAFSHAFKRFHGVAPGAYRKSQVGVHAHA